MTTRGDILQIAFEELGYASYVFDLTADEIASAHRRMDAMLSQWAEEGVDLGYVAPTATPTTSDEMDTPAWADQAIALNLARLLAPQFGKTLSPVTLLEAKKAYGLVVAKTMTLPRMARPVERIRGGGDHSWWHW